MEIELIALYFNLHPDKQLYFSKIVIKLSSEDVAATTEAGYLKILKNSEHPETAREQQDIYTKQIR